MENETIREIVEDVLLELYGEESDRPIGVGMPRDKYVVKRLEQAQAMFCKEKDLEQNLKHLTERRNKLNRQIATLKKADLKSNRDEVGISEKEEKELMEETDTYLNGFFAGEKQEKKQQIANLQKENC